jgi:hypothetical protein
MAFDQVIYMSGNNCACEQVEMKCPGVYAIRIPPTIEAFWQVLKHEWVFDPGWLASAAAMPGNNAKREATAAELSLT